VESIRQGIKNNWIFFIIIVIGFLVDRLTKSYVIDFFLSYKLDSYYFNSFLNFVLIWNTGMAFGILESDSYIYHIFSFLIFLVIGFLIIWLLKSENSLERTSIALVIGGAFGNLFDRIVYKAVPDFIDFHYLDFHWFVFNVSDIIITIGILLLILNDLFSKNDAK
jgi:signal peptidase II